MARFLTLWVVILIQCSLLGAAEKPAKRADAPPDPLLKWIEQLKNNNAEDRVAAAKHLSEYLRGPETIQARFSDLPRPDNDPEPPEVDAATVAPLANALRLAIDDKDAEVRKEAAIALASMRTGSAEVAAAFRAGVESSDRSVRWYILRAIGRLRPNPGELLPLLMKRMNQEVEEPWWFVEAIGDYGVDGRSAAGELAKLLDHPNARMREWAGIALMDTGMDVETAQRIVEGRLKFNSDEAGSVFVALLNQPKEAIRFLERDPELAKHLEDRVNRIYPRLCKGDQDALDLRRGLQKLKTLPPIMMGLLQDESFLPALDEQMKTADPHGRTLLEACARACGRTPQRIVKLSKEEQGDFKPTSAWPGSEPKRKPKEMQGHGDGFTRVLVTGTLRMADGTPARRPEFYAANDRMLLGLAERQPDSILYDQKTGKFVFLTTVFAAYAMEKGAQEPGPYQTGSALTHIEAEGAEPLDVRFFDEMPHVEIRLKPGQGKPQTRPANTRSNSGVIGGFMPPPSRD